MSRPHDMGGRFGDGAVVPEPQGIPTLDEEWQARALALTLAAGSLGQWNLDTSRHSRERLSPRDYARFSYFEKWIAALADLLVEKDVLRREELQGGGEDGPHALAGRALPASSVASVLAAGGPADRPIATSPRFEKGQAVVTARPAGNRLVDGGHTRLPAYASGAQGYILKHHGAHVLPDSNAHGLGECPQHLYTVVFSATQLWSHPEHPDDEVTLDLWESYLEPA
ncbi:nitrile hydratase subunit beta [Sedimentitalea sp. XS_ASV28]|uniref:nitrile hydratase subunit beta n=1 Tax=Sedimentitalea sp. XS_ASV28 TaxID=3241296 RepID=UPI003516FB6F